jgi:hypothetical protein
MPVTKKKKIDFSIARFSGGLSKILKTIEFHDKKGNFKQLTNHKANKTKYDYHERC